MQQVHSNKCASVMYKPRGDAGSGFPLEPPKGLKKSVNHSTSMVHPSAAASWSSKVKDESGMSVSGRTYNSSLRGSNRGSTLARQQSHKNEKASGYDDNMVSTTVMASLMLSQILLIMLKVKLNCNICISSFWFLFIK